MARLDNLIGDFRVQGFRGHRDPPTQRLQLDERPGVDGTEITKLGVKGLPFPIISWVDTADYDAAWAEFEQYKTLVGGDATDLIVAGISTLLVENYLVKVLDVRALEVAPIRPGAGGLNPPSQGFLMVQWDLLPLPL